MGEVEVAGSGGPATGAVAAVARLGDPEREVVVLRLLLGHSLAHTAHLSGYSQRAVMELQLAACLSIQEQTDGAHVAPPAPEAQISAAEEFERRLGPWEVDPTGSDPALAAALAVAGSLRQATPGYMVAPDPDLVSELRHELVTGRPGTRPTGTTDGCQPRAPRRSYPSGGLSSRRSRTAARPSRAPEVGLRRPGAVQATVGGHRGCHCRDRRGPCPPGVRQAGSAGDL